MGQRAIIVLQEAHGYGMTLQSLPNRTTNHYKAFLGGADTPGAGGVAILVLIIDDAGLGQHGRPVTAPMVIVKGTAQTLAVLNPGAGAG
eukprot:2213789-Pyramimonas_sp.AAC.1